MKKIYQVTYILSGITERTDDFNNMVDGSVESATKAIKEKFKDVWGFDPNAIEVKSVISGHYEYIMPARKRPAMPGFKGTRTFVAE